MFNIYNDVCSTVHHFDEGFIPVSNLVFYLQDVPLKTTTARKKMTRKEMPPEKVAALREADKERKQKNRATMPINAIDALKENSQKRSEKWRADPITKKDRNKVHAERQRTRREDPAVRKANMNHHKDQRAQVRSDKLETSFVPAGGWGIKTPSPESLLDFESDPKKALALFYEGSGIHRFYESDIKKHIWDLEDPSSHPAVCRLISEIQNEAVTTERMDEIINDFIENNDPCAKLHGCASCGVCEYQNRIEFAEVPVCELDSLLYTKSDIEVLKKMKDAYLVRSFHVTDTVDRGGESSGGIDTQTGDGAEVMPWKTNDVLWYHSPQDNTSDNELRCRSAWKQVIVYKVLPPVLKRKTRGNATYNSFKYEIEITEFGVGTVLDRPIVCHEELYSSPPDGVQIYHLHPELVGRRDASADVPAHEYVHLCEYCLNAYGKQEKKDNKMSIVGGNDIGLISRVGLRKPSLLEWMLLSRYRIFASTIKFTGSDLMGAASSGPISAHNMSKRYESHLICYEQLSRSAVVSALKVDSDSERNLAQLETLQVCFVDVNEKDEGYLLTHVKDVMLKVDWAYIKRASCILAQCNEEYADTEWYLAPELQKKVADTVADVVSNLNVVKANDEVEVHVNHLATAMPQNPTNDVENITTGFLCVGAMAPSVHNVDKHIIDVITKKCTNPPAEGVVHKPMVIPRISVPVNEYAENDQLVMGSFPLEFPLGKGLGDTKGPLSVTRSAFLLKQIHGQFSRNCLLIFFLFDQLQRMYTIRGINASVKNNKKSFGDLANLVADAYFHSMCRAAKQNPDGKEAKYVMERALPFLQVWCAISFCVFCQLAFAATYTVFVSAFFCLQHVCSV